MSFHSNQTTSIAHSSWNKNQEDTSEKKIHKSLASTLNKIINGKFQEKKASMRKTTMYPSTSATPRSNCASFVSKSFTRTNNPSQISLFISKLYKSKMEDLKSLPNSRQEQLFLQRLLKTTTKEKFEALQCDFGFFSALCISKYLKTSSIKILELDKNPFGDEGIIQLSKAFQKMPLVKISLSSVNISSKGGKVLFQNITGIPTLRQIDFSSKSTFNRNRFGHEGLQPLSQFFKHNNCCLEKLNLSNISMGEKGFFYLCEGLSKNSSLKNLNISMNQIQLSKSNYSFYLSKFGSSQINKLDISHNNLQQLGVLFFAELLGINYRKNNISNNLVILNLGKNMMTSLHFESFCYQMVKNKTVEQLDLSENFFSKGEHFKHFSYFLSHNWTLHSLNLRNSEFSQHNLSTIAKGITSNRSIQELDLSYNEFLQDSFDEMISSIEHNHILKNIKMQHCCIVDKLIEKSFQSLKKNQGISCFHLEGNFIHDRGGQLLLRIVMQNKKMTCLSLARNCLSLQLQKEIQFMIKQNKIAKMVKEPNITYYKKIQLIQQNQRVSLLDKVGYLQNKAQSLKIRNLMYELVEKEDVILNKERKKEQQEVALLQLQKELEKSQNFMLTS